VTSYPLSQLACNQSRLIIALLGVACHTIPVTYCSIPVYLCRACACVHSWFGLRSSRLWARNYTGIVNGKHPYVIRRTAAVYRLGPVTERAPTTTVRALRHDADRWRRRNGRSERRGWSYRLVALS